MWTSKVLDVIIVFIKQLIPYPICETDAIGPGISSLDHT